MLMTDISKRITLPDERATMTFGSRLARCCRAGDILALNGDLGSGKTVFARGFIQGAGLVHEEVPSPTFTLVQVYDGDAFPIYHFDLYRLEDPEDAFELGIEDAFADGVSLIEWPERLGGYLPPHRLELRFDVAPGSDLRHVEISGTGWHDRLRDLDETAGSLLRNATGTA